MTNFESFSENFDDLEREESYKDMYDLCPEEMMLLMRDPDVDGISMSDSWYD